MKSASLLSLTLCFGCLSQTPKRSFEVASIYPNLGEALPETQVTPGALTIRNGTILYMMQWAYDVPRPQIDFPVALMDKRFDVVAKANGQANETQLRLMLQQLLADRFALKTHTEARVIPVYAMTVAKRGPKFQESTTDGPFSLEQSNSLVVRAHHARMRDLAQGIGAEAGKVVVDETGLQGRFEIQMNLAPYLQKAADGGGQQLDLASVMFTGMRDLLGLSLEARRESVEILVIDHVEKVPTEN